MADLQVESDNARYGTCYEATPAHVLRAIFDSVDAARYPTFIDYGSGKGRALMVASEYGFRTILGVEFAPVLHRLAERNIQIHADRRRSHAEIRSIHMDALDFVPPPEPSVLFFYAPFQPPLLRRILTKVKDTVARHPRPVALAFYGANPLAIDCFNALGWRRRELKPIWNPNRVIQYRALIYETG